MNKSLSYYANLAHEILNIETLYSSNKNIISLLFTENKPNVDFEQIVKNRITVIDSYYSTQMSKRLYGIDELANILAKYSDDTLKAETNKFLNNPNEECVLKLLFTKEYGIDKSGKPFGKATSLISKYLYFLNTYKFPIYDSLAFISYKLLQNSNVIENTETVNEHNYFELINNLNTVSNINNYEKLDNLLWLIGKLSKGSFAILMDMNKYLELVNTKEIKSELLNPTNKKSSAKDEIIRNYIKEHYKTSTIFTDNQKTFFDFVFSLK